MLSLLSSDVLYAHALSWLNSCLNRACVKDCAVGSFLGGDSRGGEHEAGRRKGKYEWRLSWSGPAGSIRKPLAAIVGTPAALLLEHSFLWLPWLIDCRLHRALHCLGESGIMKECGKGQGKLEGMSQFTRNYPLQFGSPRADGWNGHGDHFRSYP